jgi:thioredoxin 1
MADNVSAVTDQNFESEVVKSGKPTLVDFWAPWCGPCRVISPWVEELAVAYKGKVNMVKMNVDEQQQTASKFSIRAIPTLLMFKNGQVVDQLVGAASKQKLEDFIQKHQ